VGLELFYAILKRMIFEVGIVPLDKGESVGKYVAKVIKIIHKSNLPHKLTAMSTQIEGEWDEVMPLIKECHEEMRKLSNRVLTSIKIDDRKNAKNRLTGKVDDVVKLLK